MLGSELKSAGVILGPGTMTSRKARWCFTTNNWKDDDVSKLRLLGYSLSSNGFLIFGFEVAPNTGTKHLQGYVRFPTPRCFNTVRLLLPNGSHIEPARGTETDNYKYCSKSTKFEEYGTKRSQGQRSDLNQAIHEMLHEGRTIREVAENYPCVFVRNYRGISELRHILRPVHPRSDRSDVYILWGPTRTGKSRAAKKIAENTTTYYKNRSNWWHGYRQEETVIIDDFYGWIKWDELLKICDRYPYKVETKGGYEEFTSKTIIITSNIHPNQWYKFAGYDPAPLLSDRINALVETGSQILKIKTFNEDSKERDIELINKAFDFISP